MIKIICVGKIKENYLKDAINEYKKRIKKYVNLEIIELPDASFDETEKNLKVEGTNILNHINKKDYIITLEIEGKEITSTDFAKQLDKININYAHICFIIGGSNGLLEEVSKIANAHISFSKLTFPHQLFRVILLEQIYRAYKINNNETYHK